jgi:protein O-GlcNAc transferase
VTIEEAMALGVRHHQMGQFAEAEALYRQVLAAVPEHADAMHLLGLLLGQTGKGQMGVEWTQTAIGKANSQNIPAASIARYWNNLGTVLWNIGRIEDAAGSYREAVRLHPRYAEGWGNLSNALRVTGDVPAAIAAGREAVQQGGGPQEWVMWGMALAMKAGRDGLPEAIGCFRRALQLQPGNADAERNLAYALREAGQFEESIQLSREMARRRPNDAQAWKNLGLGLDALGRNDEAIDAFRKALASPDGTKIPEAWSGLGNVLMARGEIEEAIDCFEKAVAAQPENAWAHSNLLFALHYDARVDARKLFAAHQEWAQRHAGKVTRYSHANPHRTGKRLRIGYMSADFREHPVGKFMLPIVRRHVARGEIDLILYSDAQFGDAVTATFQQAVESSGGMWRGITELTDHAAAELVRKDQVDILVDLSMHAGHNRMLVFARKPAPVQVTYLAYPGTTGMQAVDWRISDRYLDAPEPADMVADEAPQAGVYAERTWRLRSYWCFVPPSSTDSSAPAVTPLPAATEGVVTFGCLNNFAKVGRAVVEVWARILRETETQGIKSRLVLHAKEGRHRNRVLEQLTAHGVGHDRVSFVTRMSEPQYLATYGQIDVGLDPFPYCGGTTTCDALWMGVPVVTLRAPPNMPAVGRSGTSILSNAGLPDLVADSLEDYVQIAVNLAADRGPLAALRAGMRTRMAASPLMDVDGFMRDIEAAYRGMWECA